MPDVKQIIREMLQRGMGEEEVLATLKEIGIENPEAVLQEASKELKGAPPAEEPQVVEEHEVAAPSAAAEAISTEAIDAKLDEALALLKALQELNKKILEANREILLRLKA